MATHTVTTSHAKLFNGDYYGKVQFETKDVGNGKYKVEVNVRCYCKYGYDFTSKIQVKVDGSWKNGKEIPASGSTSYTGWSPKDTYMTSYTTNEIAKGKDVELVVRFYNDNVYWISQGKQVSLDVKTSTVSLIVPLPSAPDAPTIVTNKDGRTLYFGDKITVYGGDGTTKWYYSLNFGPWVLWTDKTSTSGTEFAIPDKTYMLQFRAHNYDKSSQLWSSYSYTEVWWIKLNSPTLIQLSPSSVSASTIIKDAESYQDDGEFTVTASGGTQPSGVTYQVSYEGSDVWYENGHTFSSVNSNIDFSQVKFKSRAVHDNYDYSDDYTSPTQLNVTYVPQVTSSDFSTKFYVVSGDSFQPFEDIETYPVIEQPGDSVGIGWSDFPLSLNKGNFSYFKVTLSPQRGYAIATDYQRNDPSVSQPEIPRTVFSLTDRVFKTLEGQKCRLTLTPSYYYKRPEVKYNSSVSEGFNDLTEIDESLLVSPWFLVGGHPDTPTVDYPNLEVQREVVTFNTSPKFLFTVTDSHAKIKDIIVQFGSFSYSYTKNPSMFKLSSTPQDSLIASGTKVVFTAPTTSVSEDVTRTIKISVVNSYGLTCQSPAEFVLNYKYADYPTKESLARKDVIKEEDYQNVILSYSKMRSFSSQLLLYPLDSKICGVNFTNALGRFISIINGSRVQYHLSFTSGEEDLVTDLLLYDTTDAPVEKGHTIGYPITSEGPTDLVEGNCFNHVLYVLKNIL